MEDVKTTENEESPTKVSFTSVVETRTHDKSTVPLEATAQVAQHHQEGVDLTRFDFTKDPSLQVCNRAQADAFMVELEFQPESYRNSPRMFVSDAILTILQEPKFSMEARTTDFHTSEILSRMTWHEFYDYDQIELINHALLRHALLMRDHLQSSKADTMSFREMFDMWLVHHQALLLCRRLVAPCFGHWVKTVSVTKLLHQKFILGSPYLNKLKAE